MVHIPVAVNQHAPKQTVTNQSKGRLPHDKSVKPHWRRETEFTGRVQEAHCLLCPSW